MRKLLRLIIIVILWRIWYRYIINNPNTDIAQKVNSVIKNISTWGTTDVRNSTLSNEYYTVKTKSRNDIPGEDIYIYDKSGNEFRSLLSQDPQYVSKLIDNYLILDIWTDASQRIVAIYDIKHRIKIFESDYHCSNTCLVANTTSVQFEYTIWNDFQWLENEPTDAPHCSVKYNGYTEKRIFDLTTQQLMKTWKYTCAYFE